MGLEEYLKINSDEYFSLYENIKQTAGDIWKNARLGWFTNHGTAHSQTIVRLLDQLCGDLLADEQPSGLQTDEVFLLLAAAWLHDIGMQDLSGLNGKSVDQLTEVEWEIVRKRHPARAQEIIAASAPGSPQPNPFLATLKLNRNVCTPLSLICMGHGSSYYEEAVSRLAPRTFDISGKGKPIRGTLLTSLLLLADELDLHFSRVDDEVNYPLSKISLLHYFRHHFVNHVEVAKITPMEKQVRITLALPEEEQHSDWAKALQDWLNQKLRAELHRTDEYIQKGFDNRLHWAGQRIAFIIDRAERYEKKLPSSEVINLLRRETSHVLDWKEAAKTIKGRFTRRTGGAVLIKGGAEQGNGHFFIHLSLLLNCLHDGKTPGQRLANMEFMGGNICGTLDQIVFSLYEKLFNEELIAESAEAMDAFLAKLKATDMFCTVFLQNYDSASPKEWNKLAAVLTDPAIRERFLFVINTEERLDDAESFELPNEFSEQDMICYFEKLGHYGAKALEKSTMLRKIQETEPKPCADTILKYAVILS